MELKIKAPLDLGFYPMVKFVDEFNADVAKSEKQVIAVSVIRNQGYTHTIKMDVFADGVNDERNCAYIERIVKTLLWAYGGYKIYIAGSKVIFDYIKKAYSVDGIRAFDKNFMERVYENPFEVLFIENADDAPAAKRSASSTGRHLDGCRIGFDAGGSDRKVSAVIDGETVYSEEVIWFPKLNEDPEYQYQGILESMKTAASKMPRVDAIGVSSAGVYVDNKIMVASLFIKVPDVCSRSASRPCIWTLPRRSARTFRSKLPTTATSPLWQAPWT